MYNNSHHVSLTVVQRLGWNQLQTAATPPPARGTTSSHTWRQIKHQHVIMNATKYYWKILIHVKPFSAFHQRSLSQHFTPSALLWISTTWTTIKLWTSLAAPCWVFISSASPITNQPSNYLREKGVFSSSQPRRPARQTQQAPPSFEVSLLKSMPGHGRVNLPLFEARGATPDRSSLFNYRDCTQTPSQENCTPTLFSNWNSRIDFLLLCVLLSRRVSKIRLISSSCLIISYNKHSNASYLMTPRVLLGLPNQTRAELLISTWKVLI